MNELNFRFPPEGFVSNGSGSYVLALAVLLMVCLLRFHMAKSAECLYRPCETEVVDMKRSMKPSEPSALRPDLQVKVACIPDAAEEHCLSDTAPTAVWLKIS